MSGVQPQVPVPFDHGQPVLTALKTEGVGRSLCAPEQAPAMKSAAGSSGATPSITVIGHGARKPKKPWQPKDHRPVEQIERDVRQAREWLSRVRNELKEAKASITMTALKRSPEFIARATDGLRRFWADPANRARQAEIRRANIKGHPHHLPPMTREQKRIYCKMRRSMERDAALREALREAA